MAPPKKKTELTPLSLVGKLAKIMEGIEPMHKSEQAGSGSYGYKFISVNSMIDIARPKLAEAGIIFFGDVEDLRVDHGLGKNGNQTFVYLTVKWHVRDGDEELHFSTIGEAADTGDKATNKAMTAAQKQAISKLLMMSGTDDDPDRELSPPDQPRKASAPKKPERPQFNRGISLLKELSPNNAMWQGIIADAIPGYKDVDSRDLKEDDWKKISEALELKISTPKEVEQGELPDGWSDAEK